MQSKGDIGYDVMSEEFVNMIDQGIIDPTKVSITFMLNFFGEKCFKNI